MPRRISEITVFALTVCLLGAAEADTLWLHSAPREVGAYQQRVREAVPGVAASVGSWLAIDLPMPPAAVALLHPNVVISRRYTNIATGNQVNFLLVQCADVRDLVGHYPPRCYVAQGWTMVSSRLSDWEVGGMPIHGTQYDFVITRHGTTSRVTIADFMLLADGSTCPNMVGIDRAARDPFKKFFGAAQLQLVCDPNISAAEQTEALHVLVENYMPIIRRIGQGVRS